MKGNGVTYEILPDFNCPCKLREHQLSLRLREIYTICFLTTLSTVRSGLMWTEVQTEPNPQVLGSVLREGGPDPYFQVRGPSLSGLDLRVEPGSDLVQTSKWKKSWC